jgi:nucleotidyltransferase substrate binding protein (TIGR01987 family)
MKEYVSGGLMSKDVRWKQRFQTFENAFKVLKSDFHNKEIEDFSELEQAGLIQHFEIVWELTWKLMKDYLENTGIVFSMAVPRSIIKEAAPAFFETAKIDGNILIEMLDTRNELSHMYDFEKFRKSLKKIQVNYLPQFENLYLFLKPQAGQDE